MQKDTTTNWITKGGNFHSSKKCKTTFILKEFYENKSIEWNLHVDSTPGPHCYDMICHERAWNYAQLQGPNYDLG